MPQRQVPVGLARAHRSPYTPASHLKPPAWRLSMLSRFQRGVRRPVTIGALGLAVAVGAVKAQGPLPQATEDATVEATAGSGQPGANSWKSPGVTVSKKSVSKPP